MSVHISNRISVLIKELGYNFNSFSKVIGLTNNTTIGRIVNEQRNPSYEVLRKIMDTFENVNAYWLLTGKGEMFANNKMEEPVAEYVKLSFDTKLLAYFREKDIELLKLSEENGKLKEKIRTLKEE